VFSEIGDLSKYWHVIGLASEVRPGRSLKRKLYGHPLLIWRDKNRSLHALSDCCAHKKTPLEVKDFQVNLIACPYHGWEYNETGDLIKVPSSPDCPDRLRCKLPSFSIAESEGFIWIHIGESNSDSKIPSLEDFGGRGWSRKFKTMKFETTDELLIENFMDPTHTASVHDGLIRSSDQSNEHEMSITTHADGVKVDFEEKEESVGPGMRLLLGRSMKVRHTDEFMLPNLVKVTYWFNDEPKFLAFIGCTPTGKIGEPSTQAFVQLRFRFGWLNHPIKPVLSFLSKKILQQDFEITQSQFLNQQICQSQKEHLVAADAVAKNVSLVRRNAINRVDHGPAKTQNLKLWF